MMYLNKLNTGIYFYMKIKITKRRKSYEVLQTLWK